MNEEEPRFSELLTLKEAAEYSGLSYSYMRQIARQGRLRVRRIGTRWVTTKEAVDEYLKSRSKRGVYRADLGN